MPHIGPDFLHQPLRIPSLPQLQAQVDWLLKGMRLLLPERLKGFKWSPAAERIVVDSKFNMTSSGVVERSMLGAERINPADPPHPDLPVAVTLSPSLIYETAFDLPGEARVSLEQTVALRLEDISPIPPGDAVHAIGDVKRRPDNRISASVAIAKKTTIESVKRKISDRPIAAIRGQSASSENAAYTFENNRSYSRQCGIHILFACISVWFAIMLLLAAVDFRASRNIKALTAYETELHENIERLRNKKNLLAELHNATPPSTTRAVLFQIAAQFADLLPGDAVIEEITYDKGQIRISGLTPLNVPISTSRFSLQMTDSGFPGFARFEAHARAPVDNEGASS